MTLADKIRSMTDEELAHYLCNLSDCQSCVCVDECRYGKNGFIDYVKKEYKE